MRVSLFITCVVDQLYPQVGEAMVELFTRLGVEVTFNPEQTCCGQPAYNTGYRREARAVAARTLELFERELQTSDYVVAPSGSCTAMIKTFYPELFSAEPEMRARVERIGGRCYELSQFLVDVLGVEDVGAYFPHRVTYHPTCHSLRGLRVGDKPLRLLGRVRGLELIELPRAAECCGFGGTFALKNADVSTAMLGDKLRHVADTGAEVCTAADNSCLMHIGGGLSRLRSGMRTMHLAEILASTEEAPVR